MPSLSSVGLLLSLVVSVDSVLTGVLWRVLRLAAFAPVIWIDANSTVADKVAVIRCFMAFFLGGGIGACVGNRLKTTHLRSPDRLFVSPWLRRRAFFSFLSYLLFKF